MADVFVSYKRQDRELVRGLVRALQERGFTVWWDNRLEWGDNWTNVINSALNAALTVVVVWTPKSVKSDGTYASKIILAEASKGFKKEVLFPVRIGPVERPFPHEIIQDEDLSNWAGNADDAAFMRIAALLEAKCGKRTPPPEKEIAAWLRAEEANDAEAFREFARNYPNSRYTADVERRAAECELRAADIALAREAALRIVGEFAREVYKPDFTAALGLKKGKKEVLPFDRTALFKDLQGDGMRLVLQAEPGGGKTTTLLDLSAAYSKFDAETIGIYVRLKDMSDEADELFSHLARLETTGQISKEAWHQLAQSGSLTIFCDGWNELNDAEREKIGSKLNLFARSHPRAGLVIGTRPLSPPPLRGEHELISLQRLARDQIREIVESRMGSSAPAALAELRASRDLRDLVRTPFFLVAFCLTRSAGTRPSTREGLIKGMLEAMAEQIDHAKPLRDVLGLRQDKYLTALAVEMLKHATAELTNDQASTVVNGVTKTLWDDGVVTEQLGADKVLGTLRDHHCLIERGASHPAFQFQHQLIGEWYAAEEVRKLAMLALSNASDRTRLDQEILNNRGWTEPVLFAVERPTGDEEYDATAQMILRAMGIDPDFAGEMIAVAPDDVWKRIALTVQEVVNDWAKLAPRRAIRVILKSGRPEFADLVWDAIRRQKDHRAANALEDHRFEHPQVLGPTWKARTAELHVEGRASLLAMLASNSGLEGAEMAVEGCLADPEPSVQIAVAEMLSFYGFDEQLARLLDSASDEAWEGMVSSSHFDELWAAPWRERAVAAAKRAFAKMSAGARRVAFALRLGELGEPVDLDVVSEILEVQYEPGRYPHDLLDKIFALEPERLSNALLERLLEGKPVPYAVSRYIKKDIEVDQERMLAACRAEKPRRDVKALAPLLNSASVEKLLHEYLGVRSACEGEDYKAQNAIYESRRTLGDTLHNAGKNTLAAIILNYTPTSFDEMGDIADVIMRAFRRDSHRDERTPLVDELRSEIVSMLKNWTTQVVKDPKCQRHIWNEVAEAIAAFPDASLLAPLRSLIEADLEARRREKATFSAAIKRGEAPPPDSPARIGYETRYAQNMLSLATGRSADIASIYEEEPPPSKEMQEAVIDVMAEFLLDPEFGGDAARVIANLRPDPVFSVGPKNMLGNFNLNLVKARREARRQHSGNDVDPMAGRILDAMKELLAKGSEIETLQAVKLAHSACRMSCGGRFDEARQCILEHGSIESISGFLEVCIQLGHEVNADAAEKCLDQLDAGREARKWEFWERWFQWESLLVSMIFGGGPMEAVERLLTYDNRSRDYDLRRISQALGNCGHADALKALERLKDHSVAQHSMYDWSMAVAEIGTADAGIALFSWLLDPARHQDWHQERTISERIAQIAEEHSALRERILNVAEDADEETLKRVAEVVRHVRTEDFLRQIVALPSDKLTGLGGAIADALRKVCVEERPIEGLPNTLNMIPIAIPKLRAQLFECVSKENAASATCAKLLLTIDSWREGYGDPIDEPRHPDITLGLPWPPVAQKAWDASESFLRSK